ncbi:MAG: DUF6884 domain-containing protein [Thermoplasmata archaeon]
MHEEQRYLVITSCSKRKRRLEKARAIELYDGPSFRVLRRRLRGNVDVLIVSAEYGLVSSNSVIEPYDKRMDSETARRLAPSVRDRLSSSLHSARYGGILVDLPNYYREAFRLSEPLLAPYPVSWVTGTIGKRLHDLKAWLIEKGQGRKASA